MAIPPELMINLRMPVVAAPLFLSSGPDLVVAASSAGVIGAFPALNARSTDLLAQWLDEIEARLARSAAPAAFATNLVVHGTNDRLAADLDVLVEHRVPLVITSLGAVRDVVDAVHAYGGTVFHDVTTVRHATKAIEAGVDGLVLVSAGAGGHGGLLNPLPFLAEVRRVFDGTICMAGALSSGADVAAVRAAGADLAYMGTRFNATNESMAAPGYKQMMSAAGIADVRYRYDLCASPANFLAPSLAANGLDPDTETRAHAVAQITELTRPHNSSVRPPGPRPWRDIWSAGQGVGAVDEVVGAGALVERLRSEYHVAVRRTAADLEVFA